MTVLPLHKRKWSRAQILLEHAHPKQSQQPYGLVTRHFLDSLTPCGNAFLRVSLYPGVEHLYEEYLLVLPGKMQMNLQVSGKRLSFLLPTSAMCSSQTPVCSPWLY